MKNNITIFLFAIILTAPATEATLIDVGGGMIYDSDLNVTWLQDANYAMTSEYDSDGLMAWDGAMTWASSLTVGGYDNWRLPTYDNTNPRPTTPTSANEFGSLWNELSGGDFRSADEVGPFINFPIGMPDGTGYQWYWTDLLSGSTSAYRMDMGCACWDAQSLENEFYAWAVRDGDVSAVPEPATLALMSLGLVGLGFSRRKKAA